MRSILGTGILVLVMLAMAVSAFATPILGSINELVNGDFQTGTWGPWEHGGGLHIDLVPGTQSNYASRCMDPAQSLLLRQVVDETKNPLWNWNYNLKKIDLVANIMCDWTTIQTEHPQSTISFRLDWWGPQWNSSNVAPTAPAEGWSPWVKYSFTANQNGVWNTVNPIVQDTSVLQWDGRPFQPRWVSVEVLINQELRERVWVDDLNLTAQCEPVPEPSGVLALLTGVASLSWLARRSIKK